MFKFSQLIEIIPELEVRLLKLIVSVSVNSLFLASTSIETKFFEAS